MSKVVLIGANHAGIAAANTLLDNYPENQVTILDRNTNLSYLGCGTALWVGHQIDSSDQLFYTNKEAFAAKGADIHMQTDVKRVDFDNKKVYYEDANHQESVVDYDKLILATGSTPIAPKLPGMDLEGVHFVKLFQDSQKVDALLAQDHVKNVVVVGAGYIGVEMAEAAQRRGKHVRIVEAADTCLSSYYDKWFSEDMDKVLSDQGIELNYGEMVTELKGDGAVSKVVTNKGEYEAELVILAIGFKPNNELGKDALELFDNGAYLVDLHQQTSIKDVYAVGDCATLYSNALKKTTYIALATNAVRSGIVAGHNIGGTPLKSLGVQGSNGISIYGYNMVSTGLNMEAAKKAGFDAVYTEFEDLQKPGFMDENNNVKIRIIYERESRRIIGSQIASYTDISMAIHMFSLAIMKDVTLEEIQLVDIFFLPHFNQPYNYITMAALSATA
ncbi:FAD-dependent oxidoreductase [Erysipelothrix sp. HDW6C]|uniref:H2O-forming NADH oxidase n=1 Tax=Erysipelothrix sp. HDW6C TaxID=2714930 RepID=UPI001409390E|nr:FAD-dependent oxidoreductase [Erysipelothrix sp. HDW6C]QIK69022.1 FAD-dependent oxidoreductase [Erysipelothrix sp. HDW6C]